MYDKSQSNKQDDVLRLGRKTVDSKIKALRGEEHTRREDWITRTKMVHDTACTIPER